VQEFLSSICDLFVVQKPLQRRAGVSTAQGAPSLATHEKVSLLVLGFLV